MRSIRSRAAAIALSGAIAALAATPGLAAAAPAGACQDHPAICVALGSVHFPPSPADMVTRPPHWPGPPDPGPLHIHPGDWVALNPQPLPPGPGDLVSLNPQPIPPGVQDVVGLLPPGLG